MLNLMPCCRTRQYFYIKKQRACPQKNAGGAPAELNPGLTVSGLPFGEGGGAGLRRFRRGQFIRRVQGNVPVPKGRAQMVFAGVDRGTYDPGFLMRQILEMYVPCQKLQEHRLADVLCVMCLPQIHKADPEDRVCVCVYQTLRVTTVHVWHIASSLFRFEGPSLIIRFDTAESDTSW